MYVVKYNSIPISANGGYKNQLNRHIRKLFMNQLHNNYFEL